MKNNSNITAVIERIAEELATSCKGKISETELKAALTKNKINTPQTLEELMDVLESRDIEIVVENYTVEEDDKEDSAELNIVRLYFDDIARYKLLSHEEEADLISKAHSGNKDAEALLVNSNLRLVVSIAKRYTYRAEFLDLINAGNIGLLTAIRMFNPEKNARLSTYATFWIKQSISRMIANCGSTIRLPVYADDIVRNLSAYVTKFSAENSREPSVSEIADQFNITDGTVEHILRVMRGCKSLDEHVASDETGVTTQVDLLVDEETNVEEDVFTRVRREDIFEVLGNVLTEKEADVICKRYGLVGDGEPCSLEEIGIGYGVSRERIRQIEKKALAKLTQSEEVFERLHPWLLTA